MHNVNVEEFRLLQKRPRGVAQQQQQQQQIVKTLITHQTQQHEIDCTDGNLSWLLNYKLEELPPVPGKFLELRRTRALAKLFTKAAASVFFELLGNLVSHFFFNNIVLLIFESVINNVEIKESSGVECCDVLFVYDFRLTRQSIQCD